MINITSVFNQGNTTVKRSICPPTLTFILLWILTLDDGLWFFISTTVLGYIKVPYVEWSYKYQYPLSYIIVEWSLETVVALLGIIKSLLLDLPIVVLLDSSTNLLPAKAPSWNLRVIDFLLEILGSFFAS